jgi:hypothetical protein
MKEVFNEKVKLSLTDIKNILISFINYWKSSTTVDRVARKGLNNLKEQLEEAKKTNKLTSNFVTELEQMKQFCNLDLNILAEIDECIKNLQVINYYCSENLNEKLKGLINILNRSCFFNNLLYN